ncbi:MAG: hypothetical protein PHE55_15100 [Methylococcaceae bacterium]|nr:hypothetical protein [Methylococcaceae bacterium]
MYPRSKLRDYRIEPLKPSADLHGLQGTCHDMYRHPNGAMLTIPAHKPIAPEYVKQFLRFTTQGTID